MTGLRRAALLGVLVLAGCGSSSTTTTSSYASQYPQQYKEDFFRVQNCGQESGHTMADCECQITYIESHAPYEWLEEGNTNHAKGTEVLNEASSQCLSEG
jgi:hypothetical protein